MQPVFLFSVLAFAVPVQSMAGCGGPAPKLCHVMYANDVAVRAVVRSAVPFGDPDDAPGIAGWRYEVEVLEAYRGEVAKRVSIVSENTSSRLLLKTGREYVIFAARPTEGDDYIAWGNCGTVQGVDGLIYTPSVERSIKRLLASTTAVIEVEARDKAWRYAGKVPVRVTSASDTKVAVTDRRGKVRLSVDPGTYKVSIPEAYRETSYSYFGIPSVPLQLVAGQCAQLLIQQR